MSGDQYPLGAKQAAQPSPDGASVRRRLFWSLNAQSLAILLRILQQIVLVPVLISGWGVDLYQDWIVVFSATSLLTMVDFGMQIYFGNAMLIAWSQHDIAAYRRYFAIAMGFYAAILGITAIVLIVMAIAASGQLSLRLMVMNPNDAFWTASVLALSTLSLTPFGIVTAIYRAHGDYSRGTVISVVAEALRGLAICSVALLGGTPLAAACVYLAIAIFFWAGVLLDQRRCYGEGSLAIAAPTQREIRDTVLRSSLYMAPTITTPVVMNAPILLMGLLDTIPGAVVAFTVARTFTGFMRQIVSQFSHPIGAELSRLQATNDVAKMRRLFMAAGRMVSGAAGLLGGFTLVAGAPFIHLWTHGEVAYEPALLAAFVMNVILMAPAQVPLMMFQYNNKPRILVISQGIYTVGTVILCLLLIKGFSATGAAIGTGLSEFASIGLLLPYAASREISLPLLVYFRRCYAVAGLGLAAGYVAAWAIVRLIAAESIGGLLALGILWCVIVSPAALFLLAAKEERSWLIRQVRSRLGRVLPRGWA